MESHELENTHADSGGSAGDLSAAADGGPPTVEEVREALTNVIDPELGLDFVELGLIYDIQVEDGDVYVTYTLTSPGCPIGPHIADQIEEFVSELPGVQRVYPKLTFDPPWTPDMMSEDAKFALGY